MNKYIVGQIDVYPVYYIPEKDIIFCKNTSVKFNLLKRLYLSSMDKEYIEDKDLTIEKEEFFVKFGCLITDKSNCNLIIKNIKKICKTKEYQQ